MEEERGDGGGKGVCRYDRMVRMVRKVRIRVEDAVDRGESKDDIEHILESFHDMLLLV